MTSSPPPDDRSRWVLESLRRHEEDRPSSAAGSPPSRVGLRYAVGAVLGQGATARVFLGWDDELCRPVAVKLLSDAALKSDTARERFRREAQAAGRLAHPHVVTVYDAGEEAGVPYLVMEVVDGGSLAELLRRGADRGSLLALLEKVARAVGFAHAQGIVHRDLKPSNILLTASGEPKVGDFGLAHLRDAPLALTRTGQPLGTPLYMAPEQALGRPEEPTPRTDVYGLGAIAYELLTGRPPFTGESESDIYRQLASVDVVPPRRIDPRIAPSLETVVLKALEKDPGRRYPTATEFAEDLRRFREGEPVLARRPSWFARVRHQAGKKRSAIAAGVLLLAALGAAAGLRLSEARERDEALGAIREQARVSLDAALRLRRAGDLRGVRALKAPLQAAYEKAVARAGRLAEPDYLRGRLHRALLENRRALEDQNRALAKDPEYAPALYERIVLLSSLWGSFLQVNGPDGSLENVRVMRNDLREAMLADADALTRVLRSSGARFPDVGAAHLAVAKGIVALHRTSLAEAKEHFREAIRIDRLLEEAWENLAQVQMNERTPASPTRASREAIDTLQTATALDQGYLPYWERLTHLKAWIGVLGAREAEDPLPSWEEAQKLSERMIALGPDYPQGYTARCTVRFHRAAFLIQHGRDPLADLEGAEQDLDAALGVAPDLEEALWWRVRIRAYRVLHRVAEGRDPSAEAARALEALDRARTRKDAGGGKGGEEHLLWRGVIETAQAVDDVTRGADPSRHAAAAEACLSELLRKQPANTSAWLWRGILFDQRGAWRQKAGGDPGPDFAAAERDFGERIRLDGGWPDVLTRRAQLFLRKGLAAKAAGGDPLPDFLRAEEDLSAALRRDPAYGAAWAGRARVRLQRGLHQPSEAAFASAAEDFEQALRVQPGLEREVHPDLLAARMKLDQARKR